MVPRFHAKAPRPAAAKYWFPATIFPPAHTQGYKLTGPTSPVIADRVATYRSQEQSLDYRGRLDRNDQGARIGYRLEARFWDCAAFAQGSSIQWIISAGKLNLPLRQRRASFESCPFPTCG